MKVKYIPSSLETPHPIIGRWYRIRIRENTFRVKEVNTYNHTYGQYVQVVALAKDYDCWIGSIRDFEGIAELVPLPLYKRAYHATRRFMATWILGWFRSRTKVFE
jgi:hypothetical protein